MGRMMGGLVCALFLLSCSPSGVPLSEKDFGDKWPFTVSAGTLACDGPGVIFLVNGKAYALNGAAMMRGYLASDPIVLPDPNNKFGKKSTEAVLNKGMEMCK
jgi:hypothetical protein